MRSSYLGHADLPNCPRVDGSGRESTTRRPTEQGALRDRSLSINRPAGIRRLTAAGPRLGGGAMDRTNTVRGEPSTADLPHGARTLRVAAVQTPAAESVPSGLQRAEPRRKDGAPHGARAG